MINQFYDIDPITKSYNYIQKLWKFVHQTILHIAFDEPFTCPQEFIIGVEIEKLVSSINIVVYYISKQFVDTKCCINLNNIHKSVYIAR